MAAGAAVRSQESTPRPQIRVQVDVVNVAVTVTDARGIFVKGLTRESFRILDDGAAQPITGFAPVEAPAQILLLVETSPAVYLIHRQHLEAAHALLGGLAADDRVALATYADRYAPLLGFSAEKVTLARTLQGLRYTLGMADLNLLASLTAALHSIEPMEGRKAIVLLSTGLDPAGGAKWEAFVQRLVETDVVIFPVALGGELRVPAKEKDKKKKQRGKNGREGDQVDVQRTMPSPEDVAVSFAEADRRLKEMAELTGGQAFFPRAATEFPAIYLALAAQLRNQYSLAFKLPSHDGKLHRIEVQVVNADGTPIVARDGRPLYTVRSRRSYRAP